MKKINMSVEREESKVAEMPEGMSEYRYPWGLQIHLEKEQMDKLDLKSLKVGSSMEMSCTVKIISFSVREEYDGGVESCATLQITDMGLARSKTSDAERAKKLYKG